MTKVCVWPDYEWCFPEDLDGMLSFKSDDFIVVTVPWEYELDSDEFFKYIKKEVDNT